MTAAITRIAQIGLASVVLLAGWAVVCPVKAAPGFLDRPFPHVQVGRVLSIEPVSSLDIVFIEGGAQSGLRNGMMCEVYHAGTVIGEVILIDVTPRRSAALILNLDPRHGLEAGNLLRIKTRPVTDFTR